MPFLVGDVDGVLYGSLAASPGQWVSRKGDGETTKRAPWREQVSMESKKKDEPVNYEKEVIIAVDPAHEEKPTLVEEERIEKEQARKKENQPTFSDEEAGCPLPDEADKEPAEKGEQSDEDEEREREVIIK